MFDWETRSREVTPVTELARIHAERDSAA
jgi:hypothetical protein